MASSGHLIATVSELLGCQESMVAYAYRLLREAGLVSKGGRGTAAAKVTPGDAAALVIATLGELPRLERLDAWKEFADARLDQPTATTDSGPWGELAGYLDNLAALDCDHTLLQAVTALVKDAALPSSLANGEHPNLLVWFVRPLAYASIRVTLPVVAPLPPGAPLAHIERRYLTSLARLAEPNRRAIHWGGLERLGQLVAVHAES